MKYKIEINALSEINFTLPLSVFSALLGLCVSFSNFSPYSVHYDGKNIIEFNPKTDRQNTLEISLEDNRIRKISLSFLGIVTSGIGLFLSCKGLELRDLKEYHLLISLENEKLKIDNTMAIEQQKNQELALVEMSDLSAKLMQNPHYARLKKSLNSYSMGIEEETETEADTSESVKNMWDSLEDDSDETVEPKTVERKELVTDKQFEEFKTDFKKTKNVKESILNVFDVNSESDYDAVVKEIKNRISN